MIKTHTFRFELPIWKILYDTEPTPETQNLLAIELRSKDSMALCVVDTWTNRINWQRAFQTSDWWLTLSRCFDGKLYLNRYSGITEPSPTDILEIDLLGDERLNSKKKSDKNYIKSPWRSLFCYQNTDKYFGTISNFVHSLTAKLPEATIFYGEIAGNVIIVYYVCVSNAFTLSPFLLVVSSQKVVLLHQELEFLSNDTALEGCIYNQNQLFFLQNKNQLKVIKFD